MKGQAARIAGVAVVHWNARASVGSGPVTRRVRWPHRRANNFGDLLGPLVVWALVERGRDTTGEASGGGTADANRATASSARLLTVGSILHLAQPGDVVWGTGVNGKVPEWSYRPRDLDLRAVRGPRTAAALRERGLDVPDVFGDPGLLAPTLLGVTRAAEPRGVVLLPNLHDESRWRGLPGYVSPRTPAREVIAAVASAEAVIASSLHGIVIADALGVPSAVVQPRAEPPFKYQDYYEGTGREAPAFAADPDAARAVIAEPALDLDAVTVTLLAAFPWDLWGRTDAGSASR
ncbi:polysaccharide pyruvyl transferase family protein [Demequina sp. NBRC 110055]|uniref:polysaccharide pyruvyl transferase family protein n=1 Tax=Demequina sp. NBRC 110055 TaxID=1570344 RepID=UPI001184BCDD|nr:polysaccharide pyruvyl transferase family protein [Demequina sp. NBRC 110055]